MPDRVITLYPIHIAVSVRLFIDDLIITSLTAISASVSPNFITHFPFLILFRFITTNVTSHVCHTRRSIEDSKQQKIAFGLEQMDKRAIIWKERKSGRADLDELTGQMHPAIPSSI